MLVANPDHAISRDELSNFSELCGEDLKMPLKDIKEDGMDEEI